MGTLAQLFAKQVERAPDAAFLSHGPTAKLSYAEMAIASGRIANVLQELGVRPGDRVAVQIPKCPEGLMLYLGAMRAGAVYVPLNTAYTPAELAYFVADAEPGLMVCEPGKEGIIEKAGSLRLETLGMRQTGTMVERIADADPAFRDAQRVDNDLAAILYTSGTTGRSKGAMLSNDNLVSNALTLAKLWSFEAADRLLHALPLYHTHGLFTATNTMMASGASMIFQDRFDADEVIAAMAEASVFMGVPTFYIRMLQCPALSRDAIRSMRLFISGSAPLSPDTHAQFEARTGHAVLERYGMTETNMNTSNPYEGARLPGSVGLPLPGVELRVVDRETGAPLAGGEIGVIEVRGANVFSGYWRKQELTKQEFRDDGFFVTGDLGRIDEAGYVWIEGRDKDLIISGGLNVYPAEIEAAIDAVPGVRESAVIGVAHPEFGEGVTAVIACEISAALSAENVSEAIARTLAAFKRPKHCYFVDELPRNAMGKIQKNQLRETYRDTYLTK